MAIAAINAHPRSLLTEWEAGGVGGAFAGPIIPGLPIALFGSQSKMGAEVRIPRQSVTPSTDMRGNIKAVIVRMKSEYAPIGGEYFDGEARSNLISLGYGLCRSLGTPILR